MYRITYSQAISEEWRTRMLEMPESKKRRIYRWGIYWGILEDGKWICETRTPTSSFDGVIVEMCTPVQMDILPINMDDLWEEEIVSFPKGSATLEYNGLVMIRGDGKSVLELAKLHGLPTPSLGISADQCTTTRQKSKCLIRD